MSDAPLRVDELVEALTVPGALAVADSTPYDQGDMHRIALKVLAHEIRVLRCRLEEYEPRKGSRDWMEAQLPP